MSKNWSLVNCAVVTGAAMLLSFAAMPAHAQAPGGSYLQSCTNVRGGGDGLFAECRRMDGSWARTALRDVNSCIGDIGNQDGQLTCNRGGPSYGSSYGPERYRNYYGR
jgi:hypothetical protein